MSLSKRSISGFPSTSGSGSSSNNTSSNKVSLGLLRGKSIATSVPTIKFSAGAEEVVEVYSSLGEEEMTATGVGCVGSTTGSPKHEHVRSTTPVEDTVLPSTPANDPWRFFTGIKGKITKSVEGKLIEYKNKSATSTSPSVSDETTTMTPSTNSSSTGRSFKQLQQQGNNSSSAGNSRSDSEDISESSLSKTQGGLSTTEGVEMSSTDDDQDEEEEDGTPSQSQLTSETVAVQQHSKQTPSSAAVTPIAGGPGGPGGLRYRLRTIRNGGNTNTETTVGESFLRALQRLAGDNNGDSHEDSELRTEQGIDVLEHMDVDGAAAAVTMQPLDLNIENVTIHSDDVIEVREVLGSEIRASLQADINAPPHQKQPNESENVVTDCRTIFNPKQFVDLRCLKTNSKTKNNHAMNNERNYMIRKAVYITLAFLVLYFVLSPLSVYFSGFILGVVSTLLVVRLHTKWLALTSPNTSVGDCDKPVTDNGTVHSNVNSTIVESMDVWMNEWPATYSPQTYSVAGTQPVHLRLHRHLLRVSNTNARLPKRDMLTQAGNNTSSSGTIASSATYTYTRHRIYDLRGATVTLLPVGLTRIRWWSKKYPICIHLASEDELTTEQISEGQAESTVTAVISDKTASGHQQVFKQVVRKRRRWHQHSSSKDCGPEKSSQQQQQQQQPVMYSKLMLDDNRTDKDRASMIDTLDLAVAFGGIYSADCSDNKEQLQDQHVEEVDDNSTKLYLFARTCRDKETWYQRLTDATCPLTMEALASTAVYQNYMDTILCPIRSDSVDVDQTVGTASDHLVWLNALLGRAWYSYSTGGEGATMRLKDRIQRKLATIRLPAFIEELKLSELSVSAPQIGQKVPVQVKWASRPVMDDRGVWVDLDLDYESSVVLILQTKLNLMRLKTKGTAENEQDGGGVLEVEQRSAIFHSDVDDSAESSSDDDSGGDSDKMIQTDGQDSDGAASSNAAANQSPNHKLIRMVDRIADSRLFRVATEYRYVQRALENVRNTDLCLRVEVRSISGRLCLNIPPPPSDRIWFGFRATPEPPRLQLRALPTVGDYNISLQHVTGWLERRLVREFHKLLVLPNMEDIVLPGLR